MLPIRLDHGPVLRPSEEREAQQLAEWRAANPPQQRVIDASVKALVRSVRVLAGRGLIGLGARLVSQQSEPCA